MKRKIKRNLRHVLNAMKRLEKKSAWTEIWFDVDDIDYPYKRNWEV